MTTQSGADAGGGLGGTCSPLDPGYTKKILTLYIDPIYSEPENYRPVSLTCVTCKLLEHILCTHLRRHMDNNDILTRFNHGFRSKHSCESQLLLTTHDLYSRLDKEEEVGLAVLDFSKAFDTVPHQRLLYKLRHLAYMDTYTPGSSHS